MPKVQKTRSGRTFVIPSAPERAVDTNAYPNYHKPYRGLPPEIRVQIWQWCIDRQFVVSDLLSRFLAQKPKFRKLPLYHTPRTYGQQRFSEEEFLAMGYNRGWSHSKRFTPLAFAATWHWNLTALDKLTAPEVKEVLGTASITLTLEYMDICPGKEFDDADFWGWSSVSFSSMAAQKYRQAYEFREILSFIPPHILERVTTLNYRPYQDKRTRASMYAILNHLAGCDTFKSLRELNLIIDSRDLRLVSQDCEEQAREVEGLCDTRGRPSRFWAVDENGYYTLDYGHNIEWANPENIEGDSNGLEWVLYLRCLHRFSIHIEHLTETQRTIMTRRPLGFHVPKFWADHGISASTTWRKVRRQWNAIATVQIDTAFQCECHPGPDG